MVATLRLTAALGALIAAMAVALTVAPPDRHAASQVALRSTGAPMTAPASTTGTAGDPVLNLTDPDPFDPCRDIPVDVTNGLGLGYTPPQPEDSLRCHYDAGNYQMAVEAIIWRSFEASLPPDAVELDIDGHRAAQYWVMKPTDWNNRWWFSCMVAFKTSYGLIQQSLFYSPVYSPNGPDCMRENLMRAHQLAPYYTY